MTQYNNTAAFEKVKRLYLSGAPSTDSLRNSLGDVTGVLNRLFLCAPHEHERIIERASEIATCIPYVASVWCQQCFLSKKPYFIGDNDAEEVFSELGDAIGKAFESDFLECMNNIDKTELTEVEKDKVLKLCRPFREAIKGAFFEALERLVDEQRAEG
jgi:hypothetical protein